MDSRKKTKLTPEDFRQFDGRAARGLEVARAIDSKAPMPYSVLVQSHSVEDFLATLTPKRLELLRLARSSNRSIKELAAAAKRDPSTVSKDVAKLVELGLVQVFTQTGSGQGVKKIVRPVADDIEVIQRQHEHACP
jgi:predicted transcriptional regulator